MDTILSFIFVNNVPFVIGIAAFMAGHLNGKYAPLAVLGKKITTRLKSKTTTEVEALKARVAELESKQPPIVGTGQ